MDATEVTNEQFAKFVEGDALRDDRRARRLKPEEFPGAPPENLVPGSAVFAPPTHAVPLNNALAMVGITSTARTGVIRSGPRAT